MNAQLPIWGLWLIAAYLAGSIPFGLLIGLARGVDLRKAGSGNVGATNAGRVLGRKWGLLSFLLDVLKGFTPVLLFGLLFRADEADALAPAVGALMWLAVAIAAVIGHIFPVWLGFKGGKGVATGLGVLLGFWPVLTIPGVAAAVVWVIVCKRTGYVSLASILAAAVLPPLTAINALLWNRAGGEVAVYTAVTTALALLVMVRHRSNIVRLREGTESKVAWAKRG